MLLGKGAGVAIDAGVDAGADAGVGAGTGAAGGVGAAGRGVLVAAVGSIGDCGPDIFCSVGDSAMMVDERSRAHT